MLFVDMLRSLIRTGHLILTDADGKRHEIGRLPGRNVSIRLHDRRLHTQLFLRPRMMIGEAFMAGTLTVDQGSIYDFLMLVMANIETAPPSLFSPLWNGIAWASRHLHQYNPISRARQNVAHHYDLSGQLYDLFLDQDRQYSCAYFERPDDDLDMAQENKKRHIAAKLRLKPGMTVLDIGCGWGGLALYLARETGADVTGLTLSVEQHKIATERAQAAGLADRVRFRLQDFRNETGRYDRIVSVGMFEHVGVAFYEKFFKRCAELLTDDGVMVLHSIGRSTGPDVTSPWIRKYIFPGGYIPALSEVMPAIEKAGLLICDMEILRLHYAETLKAWRERFMARREEAVRLYDERFARMWEFYLAASEMSFRVQNMMNFQLQLTKRQGVVPMTRDYITRGEALLRRKEQSAQPRLRLAGE